jgi:hypothetical protein
MKKTKFKYLHLFFIISLMVMSDSLFAQKKDTNSDQISAMSREEKNMLTHCPVTGKYMSYSDNYKANVANEEVNKKFPFAYQFGYRRYCKVCTRRLKKEQKKGYSEIKKSNEGTDSNDRTHCEIYGSKLLKNRNYYPRKSVEDINPKTPNAKQYCKKRYCRTCTKIYKIEKNRKRR